MTQLSYGDCDGCGNFDWMSVIPQVGEYCPTCMVKLSRTTLYEGAITGASLVERATAFDVEVLSRTVRLRAQARQIIDSE